MDTGQRGVEVLMSRRRIFNECELLPCGT